MPEPIYDTAVIRAFGMPALRTAFVIDDQFPSYPELIADGGATKPRVEVERASALYQFFHQHMIPCDIANWSPELRGNDIERIRKTDLILLDYNLAHGDITISIDIMRRLAQSSHFNTIILYTQAPNLDVVWQQVAASLRGDWKTIEDFIGPIGRLDLWESIVDEIDWDGIDRSVIESHITGIRTNESKIGEKHLRDRLEELQVPAQRMSVKTFVEGVGPRCDGCKLANASSL